MKKLLFIFILSFTFFSLFSQNTFCDGWKEGFDAGKLSLKDRTYVVPVGQVPIIGGDTYEVAYSKGYEKATGKKTVVVSNSDEEWIYPFCAGWENGYIVTMNENNRATFVVPVCPVARVNQDAYDGGYVQRVY